MQTMSGFIATDHGRQHSIERSYVSLRFVPKVVQVAAVGVPSDVIPGDRPDSRRERLRTEHAPPVVDAVRSVSGWKPFPDTGIVRAKRPTILGKELGVRAHLTCHRTHVSSFTTVSNHMQA